MLHAKFQDHGISGSGNILTDWHGGIFHHIHDLDHLYSFIPPFKEAPPRKLALTGKVISEEFFDRR